MSKHRNALRDKGPQIEEPKKQWKKKQGKKPFAIEGKYVASVSCFGGTLEGILGPWRKWHVVRSYKTGKQRDQALAHLVRKEKSSHFGVRWEYRTHEEVKRTRTLAK